MRAALPRVCVIGAGISGLVAAKVLREDDFDVTIFEQHCDWGGVWAADRTYPDLRANNPKSTYAFSDHPYPATADTFPTAPQVRAYLTSYVDRFGLRDVIRLNAPVRRVCRRTPGTGFLVTTGCDVHDFDFVVVCNGTFSNPLLPEIPGVFHGKLVHSSAVAAVGSVEGKNVVVLGGGKSGLDCAVWAARHARSTTLVCRRPHWTLPRYLFGVVRIDRLIMTRLFEAFLRYHRQTHFEAWLHGRGRVLLGLWWRGLSALIRRDVGIPPDLLPTTSLMTGFGNSGVGEDFYRFLRCGRLAVRRDWPVRFVDDQIELSSGERLTTELVIAATGWRSNVDVLAPELRALVQQDGAYHLYRHILPPRERRLGFVGYASSTASQLTSEIQAHWLSQCFRGELELPDAETMDREIRAVRAWTAAALPQRSEGQYVGPHLTHYIDDLMRDMVLPTARTAVPWGYVLPVSAARYRSVGAERRRKRQSEHKPQGGSAGATALSPCPVPAAPEFTAPTSMRIVGE